MMGDRGKWWMISSLIIPSPSVQVRDGVINTIFKSR
jgi:hypothetical protein